MFWPIWVFWEILFGLFFSLGASSDFLGSSFRNYIYVCEFFFIWFYFLKKFSKSTQPRKQQTWISFPRQDSQWKYIRNYWNLPLLRMRSVKSVIWYFLLLFRQKKGPPKLVYYPDGSTVEEITDMLKKNAIPLVDKWPLFKVKILHKTSKFFVANFQSWALSLFFVFSIVLYDFSEFFFKFL